MRGRAHWSSYLHLCSSRLGCQSSASHEGNSKIRTILPPWDFDLGAGSRVWRQTPSVLALRKFETGMVYIVSSRATWATRWDTVSEKGKKEKEKEKNLWKRDIYCFLRHHFKGQLQRKALLRTFCKMPNVSKQPKQLLLRTRYFVSKQQNFGKHF